jgi:hypothetical protein
MVIFHSYVSLPEGTQKNTIPSQNKGIEFLCLPGTGCLWMTTQLFVQTCVENDRTSPFLWGKSSISMVHGIANCYHHRPRSIGLQGFSPRTVHHSVVPISQLVNLTPLLWWRSLFFSGYHQKMKDHPMIPVLKKGYLVINWLISTLLVSHKS